MAAPSTRWTNVALVVSAVGFLSFEVSIVSPRAQTTSGTAAPAVTTAFGNLSVAKDPGPRGGGPGAGAAIDGVDGDQLEYFTRALDVFSETEGVTEGLGPRMNLDSCSGCHLQPAVGGSSPAVNPQVAFATQDGATDQVPSFITTNGPVREARFVKNPDGTPDGGVHALFTITGRDGAAGCNIAQPDFATQVANHNVIFSIPTPVFGAGLIEQIPDRRLSPTGANAAATKRARHPRPGELPRRRAHDQRQTNNNGNDGTIARFGWKAQNKSLLLFSGEAYNVEMGITNELFQTERDETRRMPVQVACPTASRISRPPTPFDGHERHREVRDLHALPGAADGFADTPGGAPSIANGTQALQRHRLRACHTPSFTTGNVARRGTGQQDGQLFSDLLMHDMGVGLADGVSQGQAGPREFRTAPLWGLGQRLFFLHDGRHQDLVSGDPGARSSGSEANGVINNFNNLSEGRSRTC